MNKKTKHLRKEVLLPIVISFIACFPFFVMAFSIESFVGQTLLIILGGICFLFAIAYALVRHKEIAFLISERIKRRLAQKLKEYLFDGAKMPRVTSSGKLKFVFFDNGLEIRRKKEIFEFSYKLIKEVELQRAEMTFRPIWIIIKYDISVGQHKKDTHFYRFEASPLLLAQLINNEQRISNYEYLNSSEYQSRKKNPEGASFNIIINGIYYSMVYAVFMILFSISPIIFGSKNYALILTIGIAGLVLTVGGALFFILRSGRLLIKKEQIIIYRLNLNIIFSWKELYSVLIYYKKNAVVFLDKKDNTYRLNIVSRKLIEEIRKHAEDKILLCF